MLRKNGKMGTGLKITVGLFAAAVLFLIVFWITLPDVGEYSKDFPEKTSFMIFRDEQYLAKGENIRDDYRPVSLSRISKYLKAAVIASEDANFYSHDGIDMEGLEEALEENLEKGGFARGGSTISQQLAKNLYLTPKKSIYRKIREYFITKKLETTLGKNRILELYLNVAEWGKGVYGCEAASRRWFGKSSADLSPREAALMAGALPSPLKFNPGNPNSRAHKRAQKIISWLCAGKKIPESECQ